MKKIMLVFGTRPEAIKMAPLVKEFQKNTEQFETIVCVTAQHREMLDQVLDLFEIKPDYDLNLMKQGQDLYDVTSRVLLGMRDVLTEVKPDLVLVHGDTTTSTASALAAFYQQIPVGHVEAGLRTHNLYSPWPEEANRQMTGRLATYHFSPTETSKNNLLAEGIKDENIFVTGNTVIDALYMVLDQIKERSDLKEQVESKLIASGLKSEVVEHYMMKELSATLDQPLTNDHSLVTDESRRLVLITGHRRENFGNGFLNICNAIKQLAETYPDVDFIYPMHLNPNVRKPINEVFGSTDNGQLSTDNVHFIEPLEYLPFVYLMSQSHLVLTDSGGIQEEAPGLGKPVLVMRDTTERPEAVDAGTVKLVGTDKNRIINEVAALLDDEAYYNSMAKANNPYGDGKACARIVAFN
ncbi:UDP-N-acetylglucosamine 2-epimerase (non-hydrolysing) [Ancylomarina subtilis]|uniref:UDP-N-acetylglucosamine 2-epimerase (non-hydrolyzing) n=1 Tax=Ancylomarina subtilis TaxID=1639035 RepID=A0A4Q7VKA0_9BACT|nr:UDP-N-acetylglucosamine 2-epimerase (non-hydrolyzing) [Ancylomarina subtilis]RZT96497.1 UDP-N-acetylglucosamine 2-epimerase (non-hydrolysing) [Ancylomarina subtilis]